MKRSDCVELWLQEPHTTVEARQPPNSCSIVEAGGCGA